MGLVACGTRRGYLTDTDGAHRRGTAAGSRMDHGVSAPIPLGGGRSPSETRWSPPQRSLRRAPGWITECPLTIRKSARSTSSGTAPSEDGVGPSGWACGGVPWAPPSTTPPIDPVDGTSESGRAPRAGSGPCPWKGAPRRTWAPIKDTSASKPPSTGPNGPKAPVRPPTATRAPSRPLGHAKGPSHLPE